MSNPQSTRKVRSAAAPQPNVNPSAAADVAVPEDLDEAELALARATIDGIQAGPASALGIAAGVAEPALDPPGTPGAARSATNAGAFPNVRVLALFTSDHATNGWLHLDGVGWRKIANANVSAHVNLGLLGSAARAQGTPTPVRHEADNQVHEIYLW